MASMSPARKQAPAAEGGRRPLAVVLLLLRASLCLIVLQGAPLRVDGGGAPSTQRLFDASSDSSDSGGSSDDSSLSDSSLIGGSSSGGSSSAASSASSASSAASAASASSSSSSSSVSSGSYVILEAPTGAEMNRGDSDLRPDRRPVGGAAAAPRAAAIHRGDEEDDDSSSGGGSSSASSNSRGDDTSASSSSGDRLDDDSQIEILTDRSDDSSVVGSSDESSASSAGSWSLLRGIAGDLAERRSKGGWLKDWLNSLVITVPTIVDGKVELSGTCRDLDLGSIEHEVKGQAITVVATGLSIKCDLAFKTTLAKGTVSVEVEDSRVGGSLFLRSNGDSSFLMPSEVEAGKDCLDHTDIKPFKNIEFKGSLSVGLIEGALRRQSIRNRVACFGLRSAITSPGVARALRRIATSARDFMKTEAKSPPMPPPLPEGPAYVDFSRNKGLQFVSRLVNEFVGDQDSRWSLDQLMDMSDSGHWAEMVIKMGMAMTDVDLPITFPFKVKDIGTISLKLRSIRTGDTSYFPSMKFDILKAQELGFGIDMKKLAVHIDTTLDIQFEEGSGPLRGDSLHENLTFLLKFESLGLLGTWLLPLDMDVLGNLSIEQLSDPGCVLPGVVSPMQTSSELLLLSAASQLKPSDVVGLEADVDMFLNSALDVFLSQYMPTMQKLADHALKVSMRDRTNEWLRNLTQDPGVCHDPPQSFSNLPLGDAVMSMANWLLFASGVALAVGKLSQRMPEYFVRRYDQVRILWMQYGPFGKGRSPVQSPRIVVAPELNGVDESEEAVESGPPEGVCPRSPPTGPRSPPPGLSTSSWSGSHSSSWVRSFRRGSSTHRIDPDRATAAEVAKASRSRQLPLEGLSDELLESYPLYRHPRLPLSLRVAMPTLTVATVLVFFASNCDIGATVETKISLNGEEVLRLPSTFAMSLISSVSDMWRSGAVSLSILVGFFSGIWPYTKLFMMLVGWFSHPSNLSAKKRHEVFDFLDAYGKWSLVDAYMLVVMVVGFRYDIIALEAKSLDWRALMTKMRADPRLTVFIHARPGFYRFLAGTVLSLISGHAMTACNRFALKLGEYGSDENYLPVHRPSGQHNGRQRLCSMLRERLGPGDMVFIYGPVVSLLVSLLLVSIGVWIEVFHFQFQGLGAYILGQEKSLRPYSVLQLAMHLPEASYFSWSFGVRCTQAAFLFFAVFIMPAYLIVLLCLWMAPLTNREHRKCLVFAQILNAWSGLDVFVVSILASVMEISRFAHFMVGDKCDSLEKMYKATPLAGQLPGSDKCFDLTTGLRPGFYLLAIAAIVAMVTGNIVMKRCSDALLVDSTRRSSSFHVGALKGLSEEEQSPSVQLSTINRIYIGD